jgi:hypothetical protein
MWYLQLKDIGNNHEFHQPIFINARIKMRVCIYSNWDIYEYRGGELSECEIGYGGMLCSECIGYNENKTEYYARTGLISCMKCDKLIIEAFKLIGFLIFCIFYIVVLTM